MFISGDKFTEISNVQVFDAKYFNKYIKKFCNYELNLFNFNKENYNDKNLIFITKIEHIDLFFLKIVPLLKKKFILITHYGDRKVVGYNKYLKHPLLIKWYGQNMSIISDKTECIPIGLENKYWGRTKVELLEKFSKNKKEKLLYLNFNLKSSPSRKKIMNNLLNKGFKKNNKLNWDLYVEELSNYKFCISPNGNGIDCHRTWECLYLGIIPIVEKSTTMNYFKDLPILFVNNYDIIDLNYLNKIYIEFKEKKFNLNKLNINYWRNKIINHFK